MPSLARPTSSMSLRPSSISQPNVPTALDLNNVPSELQLVFGLLSLQAQRPYCDGYLMRKHANLSGNRPGGFRQYNIVSFIILRRMYTDLIDGKPAPDQEWYEFFAQLNGTILSLWDAEEVDQAAYMGGQSVMPQFINITDAIITTTNPQEHPEHYILSLSTAGSNRYLFEFQNPNVLKRWSAAFRIAMYERAALQECYTAALIARARTAPNVRRLFAAYHGVLGSKGKYSGWVRVRFSWSIKWQKCWCVVSDTPSSWSAANNDPGIHGRLLSKFSNKLSLRGEARFYESRRDPKNKPIAILSDAFAAYAVYPEKSFLVDSSTLIKVEGSLRIGRAKGIRAGEQFNDAFILLLPDDLPTTSSNDSSPNSSPVISSIGPSGPTRLSSNTARSRFSSSSLFSAFQTSNPKGVSSAAFENMLTWLVAFYDAFNLYGRPEKLITDTARAESMIFAMPSTPEDSYLDVEDVFVALAERGNLENNTYSTREWRSKLKDLTMTKLGQGKKVFNQAVLLKNTVADTPIIRQPIPPHFRNKVDTPKEPIHLESTPAVRFTVNPESPPQVYPPPPAAQRQPSRLGGVLRKKSSRSGPSGHNRSLTDGVANTRVAMKRFSLNDDSEDDKSPELFQSRGTHQYQSSPLRNSQVLDAEAVDMQARVGRPASTKRASSYRRAHSETRMADIYRESESTNRVYNSDEESEGRPHVARRVSSDDMLKAQSGAFLGLEQGGSRGSLDTGTQFNNTFDENRRSRIRISESSSDVSYTLADPLRDTPRMDAVNAQSSPASSMESLPPSKLQASPPRPRRSTDDRMYNAGPAPPPDSSFNSPLFRDQSQPSASEAINGHPIPVHLNPSPSRPPNAQGPRSAPWSATPVPVGTPSKADDVLNCNQEMLRPRDHRPAPTPASTRHPHVVNYPSQPDAPQPHQFPGAPDNRGPHQQTVPNLQMHARGPAQQQRAPYPQNSYHAQGPQKPEEHRIPRRIVPGQQAPISNRSRSDPSGPDGGAAAAAARTVHYPRPSSPAHSRSVSPHKSSARTGYPQGPRRLAPPSL